MVVGCLFYLDAQRHAGLLAATAGGQAPPLAKDAPPAIAAPRSAKATVQFQPTMSHIGTPTLAVPPGAGSKGLSAAASPPSMLTPRQQRAASKLLVEGHWNGMEVIELVPELARENGLDPSSQGLLIDEVTLEAAESGLRAGDLLLEVGGVAVSNLQAFRDVTFLLRDKRQAELRVLRGQRPLRLALEASRPLGAAMFEAAPPIAPGAVSPHKEMGQACTSCHVIMASGGQLRKDAGDILPVPPAIAANAKAPHGQRGPCSVCHRIVPEGAK